MILPVQNTSQVFKRTQEKLHRFARITCPLQDASVCEELVTVLRTWSSRNLPRFVRTKWNGCHKKVIDEPAFRISYHRSIVGF